MRRLLIRPGAIGDLIVSLPVLESLRADYLEVWVAEQNVPLIRFADAVCSITSTGLDILEIRPPAKLVERLRGFDSIVSWYGASRPEFREAVAKLGLPVEHALACSNNLKVVPRIPVPADAREDFAVIHPFASSPRKRWPVAKFQEVARQLKMPVRWCAGPEEKLDEAVRIDNLYELACWLSTARVYIGNDSGISHLAAAVGTPVVVLFGPTDPAVWAPRGDRVRVLEHMESVEPADVVAAVEAI
jgi:heptosyltransferase III